MSARARWLILGFAVTGLLLAGSSTWVHYKLLSDASYISPCDVSATLNCSQVYLSRFGAIAGVPVAVAGLIYFGFVTLLAWFARPGHPNDGTGGYIFAASLIGLVVSIYLAYVSFFVLRTGCLLCMGTYVCVVAIFLIARASPSTSMTTLASSVGGDVRAVLAKPSTLLVALAFLAGSASVVAFFPKEGARAAQAATASAASVPADDRQKFAAAWAAQPRTDLGIPAEGARVLVVKFNDYECPSCRVAHEIYKPVVDKFAVSNPGAVRMISKDWPWDSSCNFNASRTIPGHEGACFAAAAARMARERGKFEEMETWLFRNQPTTQQMIRQEASKMLGITNFDAEYAKNLPGIRRDIADGGALRVGSTPTLFINGVRIPSDGPALSPEYFELAITLELQRAAQ